MLSENVSCPAESDGHEESQGNIDNDYHGTDCDKNNQKTSGKDNFPVDLDDPFENATCNSDLVLLVEDRRMNVHKSVLSLHSPVFNVMLNSPDFAEKNKKEINLPGKKYGAMLDFLKQMYPVYSVNGITNDTTLQNVLPLAQEYLVEHLRQKCGQYIDSCAASTTSKEAVLQCLLLCDKYKLTDYNQKLTYNAAFFNLKNLECDALYQGLQQATQSSIQRNRCLRLEGVVEGLNKINKIITGYDYADLHKDNCNKYLDRSGRCFACLALELEKVGRLQRETRIDQ